mmetsp:Transcript_51377/g.162424  ORF Transcript_51377/g.162424 Transcript_51377/m.162424 type:complete len:257 (+) Transcript_51377:1336-2106(+)
MQRAEHAAEGRCPRRRHDDASEDLRERPVLLHERGEARPHRLWPQVDRPLPHLEQEGLDEHRVARHDAPVGRLVRLRAHRRGRVSRPMLEQQEEAVAALAQPLAPVPPPERALDHRGRHRVGHALGEPQRGPRVERRVRLAHRAAALPPPAGGAPRREHGARVSRRGAGRRPAGAAPPAGGGGVAGLGRGVPLPQRRPLQRPGQVPLAHVLEAVLARRQDGAEKHRPQQRQPEEGDRERVRAEDAHLGRRRLPVEL